MKRHWAGATYAANAVRNLHSDFCVFTVQQDFNFYLINDFVKTQPENPHGLNADDINYFLYTDTSV